MTQEQIIEGNKLIAEFMGLKQVKWDYGELLWVHKDFKEDFTDVHDYSNSSTFDWGNAFPQTEKLFYHSSWAWIMPVVEKIESMGYDVFINGLYCRITDCGMSDFELESGEVNTKIEAIWFTVIEFIKWYNSCQKEENLK